MFKEQLLTEIELIQSPHLILDKSLKVVSSNSAFTSFFKLNFKKIKGRVLFGSGKEAVWKLPTVTSYLKKSLSSKNGIADFEINFEFPKVGQKNIKIRSQRIRWKDHETPSILLTFNDLTELKILEELAFASMERTHALQVILRAANEASTLEEVAQPLMKAICDLTSWESCSVHGFDESLMGDVQVTSRQFFYSNEKMKKTWVQFESMRSKVQLGLPQKVLKSKKAQLTYSISKDSRFKNLKSKEFLVNSGFAFPVFVRGKVAAIIEFWTSDSFHPTRETLELITAAASQMSQVLLRKQIEDENKVLLQRESELRGSAERDNKTKDFFIATLSHELRTPLTSILLWIQIVNDSRSTPEKIQQGIAAIEVSAHIQEKLINDLLDTSRIVMGKLHMEFSDVNLALVLKVTLDSVAAEANEKLIKFIVKVSDKVGPVSGDSLRLQQILWNLVTNAIKFSPFQGKIYVSLKEVILENKRFAEIRVEDHGCGIPKQFLTQVFDWFSQVDNSRIREHNGLGLGLAISKNLVELQGGFIFAESDGLNEGAQMTVQLPIKVIGDKIVPSYQGGTPKLLGQKVDDKEHSCDQMLCGRRILIVENEESIAKSLSMLLTESDAEVLYSLNVASAFKVFKSFKPDIVLCDIGMPGHDGFSLVKKIRKLKASKGGKTPCIAVTAYVSKEDIQHALEAGFQIHVAKPIDMVELINSINILTSKTKV